MSYIWDFPTKVLFGAGTIHDLCKEKMPGKKALLVISNGRSVRRNGSLEIVTDQLNRIKTEYVLFDKIQANPQAPTVMDGVRKAREEGCDFVIGLGGGSVLDAATVIAALAVNEGTVWDYMPEGTGGGKTLKNKSLPCIEITTSAGTGSEVDPWGVITNPETCEKMEMTGDYPVLAIVDPELMVTVPPIFTAYQGFDALFHNAEGYISNLSNEMSDVLELGAIRDVADYLPSAVRNGSDVKARTKVAFANTLGGYSMMLTACTSMHSLSHALSAFRPEIAHGAALIMISVEYFKYFILHHACDERFIQLARVMGRPEAKEPLEFIEALKSLQRSCGVYNLKMSDYGITQSDFMLMAINAKETMNGLFECDRIELPVESAAEIFKASYR